MSDVISVRLQKGTVKKIKEITKELYCEESIADYVRKTLAKKIKEDESFIISKGGQNG